MVQLRARMREECDLPSVLKDQGFEAASPGGQLNARFGRAEVSVGVGLLTPWSLFIGPVLPLGQPLPRAIVAPNEYGLCDRARRITHLLLLAHILRGVVDEMHMPTECQEALDLWRREVHERSQYQERTTIYADREFFRLCLKRVLAEVGPDVQGDRECELLHRDEQLQIKSETQSLVCPARGQWPHSVWIRIVDLREATKSRFTQPFVDLQIDGPILLIRGFQVPVIRTAK